MDLGLPSQAGGVYAVREAIPTNRNGSAKENQMQMWRKWGVVHGSELGLRSLWIVTSVSWSGSLSLGAGVWRGG
jgi:hypothetical protein